MISSATQDAGAQAASTAPGALLATPKVLRLPANAHGRDFVVGDLHGAYDLLFEAMQAIGFISGRDRLFSVGDLIDRGPDSRSVITLLDMGLVAVRGNHEQMLLELVDAFGIDSDYLLPQHHRNGLGWWLETPLAERQAIVAALAQLPLAIEVATSRGTVGLVHADVPAGMAWPEFCERLEAGDDATIHCALWSRERHRARDACGVPGIGRVLVGHTPCRDGVERLGNVFFVDTGAVFAAAGSLPGAGLTIAQLAAATSNLDGARPRPTLLNLVDPGHVPASPFTPPPSASA